MIGVWILYVVGALLFWVYGLMILWLGLYILVLL